LPVSEPLNFSRIAASNGTAAKKGGIEMIRNAQVRPRWLATIVIGSAAMLLFAPSAAWADSGHNDYDRDRTHGWYQSHSAHRHHASHKRNKHAFQKRHHKHGKRRGYDERYVGYYCQPCDHYFSARDELYDHVAYQHRVPYRQLSLAVSFGAFGWIFFG
jgi:hypothetical protein